MKISFFSEKTFWILTPFLWGLFLILFCQIPFSLMPYYHQSFPFIAGVIFYFSVFNPKVLNVFIVFLLGLIADMITSLPLGFNAFGYVLLFFVANLLQSYLINMIFIQQWLVFCLLFFCIDVVWAFLFFLISGIWVSTGFWFVQYLFICISYPLICRFSGFLNHKIMEVK